MIQNYWDTVEKVDFGSEENNDGSLMSHMTVEVNDLGQPIDGSKKDDKKFVYVDEQSCIGCKYCASVAPGTFFMEEDYNRARVYR